MPTAPVTPPVVPWTITDVDIPPPPPVAWPPPFTTPPRRTHSRRLALLAALALVGLWSGYVVVSPSLEGSANPPSRGRDSAAAVLPGVVNINVVTAFGSAEGTGMVISTHGAVLTNNHVIEGATAITVELPQGEVRPAHVVGYDVLADVAEVQIDATGPFTTVSLGDSSTVDVGTPVIAVGNALGKGGSPTVTSGRITGLDQTVTASDETGGGTETVAGMFETDAQIQPGDSGGPLATTSGSVIGMDTAAQAAGSNGMAPSRVAFAIPINTALAVIRTIDSGRGTTTVHVGGTRGILGVNVDTSAAAGAGVTVIGLLAGSPATTAGVTVGSKITAVAGAPVTDSASLRAALLPFSPGQTTIITWTTPSAASRSASVTLASGPPA